jgi:cytochrome c oxidase subunit II
MAADGLAPVPPPAAPHGRRLIVLWVVATVIVVPLAVLLLGPHMPPGTFSAEARDQRDINTVLMALALPVLLGVSIFFIYAAATFRQRGDAIVDGPPAFGHDGLQIAWIVTTSVIVILLAGVGSYRLFASGGAGGGQGPSPIALPSGSKSALPIQVIGQQWAWNFRYPTAGGVMTPQLALPEGRLVALHVTSLDVNHSFWAIQLGVKADAVPGNDNVAFVRARRTGTFEIRCAELCGLWHGHMFGTGLVLSPPAFAAWLARQRVRYAPATRVLPRYAKHYFPQPYRRAG